MNETQRHTNLGRQTTRARAAAPRRRNTRPAATARRTAAALLALGLLAQIFAAGGADVRTARAQTGKTERAQGEIEIEGAATQPAATATINFAGLTARDPGPGKDTLAALNSSAEQVEPPPAPPEPESESKAATQPAIKSSARASKSDAGAIKSEGGAAASSGGKFDPLTAAAVGDESRAPAASYTAQTDNAMTAPPDASGAVGQDKVLSAHRSNYVIQDKATGAVISSVSAESFWAATGASGIYNSRAIYDPDAYGGRWLLAAASNARSASSSVLIAVSESSDPQGGFYIFRYDADPNDQLWADYVSVGFNANWIALTFNAHNISNDAFNQGVVLAISHPHLRWDGESFATRFPGITATLGGFSMQPAVTYSEWLPGNSEVWEENEYFVSHLGSAAATYRVSWLTGTPTAPTLFIGAQKQLTALGGWTQPGGEILPQAGGARKIDSSDSRVQKVVLRNGSIYYCQTVGLPAGRTAATVDRTAAQWVQLTTAGDFVQGGRIEDPSATQTNGGKWYAYPSLSVNRLGDVMVGFTEFSSAQYASAGYALRAGDDPAGTTRTPRVYKAGEGHYDRALPGARNLWGLYSGADVDPANDLDLWTIQEYAAQPAGTGPGSGRWATSWAKVVPPSADRVAFVSNRDGNDEIYVMESDGSHPRRLTNNPAQDTSPAWSPDRTRLAFTRYGPNGAEIYVVKADGTDETYLTQGSEPSWSPGGNGYIAFVRDIDIWTHLYGDGEEINVTYNNEEGGYYYWCCRGYYFGDISPDWSPDGSTIVFEGVIEDTRRIFTIPYWGGQRTLINGGDGITGPNWSPDGTKIAYTDYGRLCTMNPDGTNRVCSATVTGHGPAWSPDSRKIAFGKNNGGNMEVFVVNRDYTGQVNLTNSPTSNDWDPAW